MFRLDDRTAVVIGGAGGLGKACALALARQGARVVVASRSLEKLQEVVQQIKSDMATEATALEVDVTNDGSVARLSEQVVQKFRAVDILVNAHGVATKMPASDIDAEKWDSLFSVNVKGVMLACKNFGKVMMAQKKGKIINLSSVRGVRATDGGNMGYGATKGAVDMITRMLAAEWAPYNINVNAVAPSIVLTDMLKRTVASDRLEMLLSKTLFKKFASPEDVAAACVYLASSEADYVTGQILYVDGGLTAVG